MNKTTILLIGLIVCLPLFCACSLAKDALNDIAEKISVSPTSGDEDYTHEDEAEKLGADKTYYNGFLGFAYTVPAGWWIYTVNADNFAASAAANATLATLDVSFDEDYNYMYMYMAYMGNLQYSAGKSHIGVSISAEKIEDVATLEEYIDEYVEYMLEPYENRETFTLLEEDSAQINGRPFMLRVFNVEQEDRPYYCISYTCAVNGGYFLTVRADYWPENKYAPDSIRSLIEDSLEFI